jgi:hypothetical protein
MMLAALVLCRDQWWAVVNAAMDFWVSCQVGKILNQTSFCDMLIKDTVSWNELLSVVTRKCLACTDQELFVRFTKCTHSGARK